MLNQKRINTMRKRLGSASDLVNNDSYLPRARRVQMDVTPEEFDGICRLARQADNPQHYFMRAIAKDRLESTLKHVRRILRRSVAVIRYVAKNIRNVNQRWLGYVADKVAEANYSMADVVNMVDCATQKQKPDRYLVGILKRGYRCFSSK